MPLGFQYEITFMMESTLREAKASTTKIRPIFLLIQ